MSRLVISFSYFHENNDFMRYLYWVSIKDPIIMIYSDLYSPAFSPLCIYLFNLFGFGNYQPSEHSWSLFKLHRKTIWHLFPNDFFVYHVTKKCSIAIGRFNLAGNSTSLPRFRFISHSAVNGVQTVWFGRTQSLHGFTHSRL